MRRIVVLLWIALLGSTANAKECVAGKSDGWWVMEEPIMGTMVHVELWHTDRATACAAIVAVMREMHRIDNVMSPYKETSVLSQLNREGARRPVFVGRELFYLIRRSVEFSEMTEGAFDVTYASAGQYYDFRAGERPSDEALTEAAPSIDYRHLAFSEATRTIRFTREGVSVDLGGIAKGYAVDRGITILKARGITEAMVAAGGDSRILGDRHGEPWMVGIRDPRAEDDMVAMLPLMDVSVSTSGDYERYFEEDGVRYHHIIDPGTGDSAREVRSVTIIGNIATSTDALSTSVFVMGVAGGLELINNLPGVDAVIVDAAGEMHFSASLLELAAAH